MKGFIEKIINMIFFYLSNTIITQKQIVPNLGSAIFSTFEQKLSTNCMDV